MSHEDTSAVYYDVEPGEGRLVQLGDPMVAARFTSERPLKLLPESDVQSLVSPQVGGGKFHRAIPLAEGASRFGIGVQVLEQLAAAGEIRTALYLPKQAAPGSEVKYMVLDPASVKRLRTPTPPPAATEKAPPAPADPTPDADAASVKKGKAPK